MTILCLERYKICCCIGNCQSAEQRGPNQFWDVNVPVTSSLKPTNWDYGPYHNILTAECEFCQIYLRMLGSGHKYRNMRNLLSERWISIRSNMLLFDIWSYHGLVDYPAVNELQNICNEKGGPVRLNRVSETELCVNWELTEWARVEGGYIMDVCSIRTFDYDCSIDTSNGTYTGDYVGLDIY
jgi:hypothetical protein